MFKDSEMDVFVGIEEAVRRIGWTSASGQAARNLAVRRDDEGLASLVERLRALHPVLVVLEATGGYETVVASAVAVTHLPLAVINPRQIRDFARSTGKLAKTDRLDAAGTSLTSPKPYGRLPGPSLTPKRSTNWWRAVARSSR